MKAIIGVVLLLFFGGVLRADNVVFESGPKKVQLLELFTSEGCSSCPPAEASLAQLVKDSRLWRAFVPIAFHVDYWDRLGWKDPFASSEWTKCGFRGLSRSAWLRLKHQCSRRREQRP